MIQPEVDEAQSQCIISPLRFKIHKCNFNHLHVLRKFSRSMKSYYKLLSNEIEELQHYFSAMDFLFREKKYRETLENIFFFMFRFLRIFEERLV